MNLKSLIPSKAGNPLTIKPAIKLFSKDTICANLDELERKRQLKEFLRQKIQYMVTLRTGRWKCECGKQTVYGYEDNNKASLCSTCRIPGMTDIRNPKCLCKKVRPSFGFINDFKASCCNSCKKPNMINIKDMKRLCECKKKRPSFGFMNDEKPTRCADCAKENMVNLIDINRKCKCGRVRPAFGLIDDLVPTCCNSCKKDRMINIIDLKRLCKCGTRPVFGFIGDKKATCCKDCKEEHMEDIISKKCLCGLSQPSFGFYGDKNPTCCSQCLKLGMLNICLRLCVCTLASPTFGFIDDLIPSCCRSCRKDGMVDIASRRCKQIITTEEGTSQCERRAGRYSYYDDYCSICFHQLFPDDPRARTTTKLSGAFIKACSDLNINITPEFTFADCRDFRCLPFDAFCNQYDFLAELDGMQHFRRSYLYDKFEGDFEKRVYHDLIKVRYAIKHKRLFRIAYNCLPHIEKILKQVIQMIINRQFKMNEGLFFYTPTNYLHYQNTGNIADNDSGYIRTKEADRYKEVYAEHCDLTTPMEEIIKFICQSGDNTTRNSEGTSDTSNEAINDPFAGYGLDE
jgi:hypothetical protein